MEFWNFVHDVLGLHVWTFLAYIGLAIMGIAALVHSKKQKNREKDYEEQLNKLSANPESSPEDSPEKKEDAEA